MSELQDETELHRVYQEARSNRNSYFEKLALLDGGTVALVITAVLRPLHGAVRHTYLLGVGLTFLVVAMLVLLRRNLQATQFEFHAAANTARSPMYVNDPNAKRQTQTLNKHIHYTEIAGVLLSAIGIVLLLIEVWFILLASGTSQSETSPAVSAGRATTLTVGPAEEAYRLQDDCTRRGEAIIQALGYKPPLEADQLSRYNATTNRCYVRILTHGVGDVNDDPMTVLEDGQTKEVLGAYFRDPKTGKDKYRGFGCGDSACVQSKVASCMNGKECNPQ
jgi:hypothetical protein